MQTWDKRWMESHVFFCSLQIKSRACFVCMTVTHFFCPASRTSRRTVISMAFSKETRVSNLLVAISFNRRYWLIFWILSLFVIMPVHLFSSAASMRLTANSCGTKERMKVRKQTNKKVRSNVLRLKMSASAQANHHHSAHAPPCVKISNQSFQHPKFQNEKLKQD